MVLIPKMWYQRDGGAHNDQKQVLLCVKKMSRKQTFKKKGCLNVMKHLCFLSKAQAKGYTHSPTKGQIFMSVNLPTVWWTIQHRIEWNFMIMWWTIVRYKKQKCMRDVFVPLVCSTLHFSQYRSFIYPCWCHSSPITLHDMNLKSPPLIQLNVLLWASNAKPGNHS